MESRKLVVSHVIFNKILYIFSFQLLKKSAIFNLKFNRIYFQMSIFVNCTYVFLINNNNKNICTYELEVNTWLIVKNRTNTFFHLIINLL